MSQIKTPQEIEYIREACIITDQIFSETLAFIKKQKKNKTVPSEIEVQDFIMQNIKERKLRPSFSPIVTSGKRAGNEIHPKSTKEQLQGFVIIDLGVRYKGYCSDMTRTMYVGVPTQEEKELYKIVLDSQILGIKKSTVNVHCSEIDSRVRGYLGKYKKYFIHTLGHGVGCKIHEAPIIYEKRTKAVLKEGMVITIEPGIYIKNRLGIRIEDTILVTDLKPHILTKTAKKLILL